MFYVWVFLTFVALTREDAFASSHNDVSQTFEETSHPSFKRALDWYPPSEDEMKTVTSWGFEPAHMGAALRYRAFIKSEDTPVLQKVLASAPWEEAFSMIARAAGAHATDLALAATLPLPERQEFLRGSPREDTWIYAHIGLDPDIDMHVMTYHMRRLLGENRPQTEETLLNMVCARDELTKKRVATFLWNALYDEHFGYCSRYAALGIIDASPLMRQVQHMRGLVLHGLVHEGADGTSKGRLRVVAPWLAPARL
ncbi:MAG: hypothetical protein C0514_02310 [Candidatus Puniceispirillum sp.]|nr:hypothetical protein [Candidatus Puniceispirillum sp.]